MRKTTSEYKEKIRKNRIFHYKAVIRLADGAVLNIGNDDLMSDGWSFQDSTSANTFTIGSAIIGSFTLRLRNDKGQFSRYDFMGASIIPSVGLELSGGIEWINKETYHVLEPVANDVTITIKAWNKLSNLDKDYDSSISYPATLRRIIEDACVHCGLSFMAASFDGQDMEVERKPEMTTYRQVVSWCAQIAGYFVQMSPDNTVMLRWYDFASLEKMTGGLDGGNFIEQFSGDMADGGNFMDYSSGDSVDGGRFEELNKYHIISALKSKTNDTDDVVITGIRVITEDEEFMEGTDGYVLEIDGNELISNAGIAQSTVKRLGNKIIGSRFRKLSVTAQSDPSIEAGDIAVVVDRKGNAYHTIFTSVEFKSSGIEQLKCDAESALINSGKQYKESTRTNVTARKEAKKEISRYDLAVKSMTDLIVQGFGLYQTALDDESGGRKYFLHDKPDMENSTAIWQITSTGLVVSKDGGTSWAVDVNGNALFNVIIARGISADWIDGGVFTAGGRDNVNGRIYVKDAQGRTLVILDNSGITLAEGVKIGWKNISGSPSIPTKTSDLTNDSDFATTRDIPSEERITTITENTVTSEYIKGLKLKVGEEIEMGNGAKIRWENVSDKPNDLAKTGDIPSEKQITEITKNTLKTENVEATNLKITGGSIDIKTSDESTNVIVLTGPNVTATYAPHYIQIISTSGTIVRKTTITDVGIGTNYGAQYALLSSGAAAFGYGDNRNLTIEAREDGYAEYRARVGHDFKKVVVLQDGAVFGDFTPVTSDRKLKENGRKLDVDKVAEFIYSLVPREYTLKRDEEHIVHHGLYADEVYDALNGEERKLYADNSENEKLPEDFRHKTLCYDDLHADYIATLQSQNRRICVLEDRIRKLEGKDV
ncbi:MAG: tail fiber domain-containing protein [Alistipes sp.]|nr:tail fiber domain-containing protein [Alistipes sp.]